MFTLTPDTVAALVASIGNSVWAFMPIIALYLGLPAAFYIFARFKSLIPKG